MSSYLKEHLLEIGESPTSNETIKSTRKPVESVLQCKQFQHDACRLIDGSNKSLNQLVTQIHKTMRNRFFAGEKVYRIDGSEEVYTVVEKISEFFLEQYKIQSASKDTSETVYFINITRPHHIFKSEVKAFINELAEQQPDGRCFLMAVVFIALIIAGVYYLLKKDAPKLALESMNLVAEMDRTILNDYFKELVANETMNAVDHPLAAEGLAHMFWFESNLKNRTTLDEYVDRMKPTQQSIFYAYDHSKSDIEQRSTVRSLVKSGNEVLFVTNPLDKRVIDRIDMFRGKLFVDTKRLILIKNETAILAL